MYRGTTPTINIIFKDKDGNPVDMSVYSVYLTFEDMSRSEFTITNDRMTFNQDLSIDIVLTQEETLALHEGMIQVQLRAVDSHKTAIASNIVTTQLGAILKEGII